jgi:hypothetical protein
VEPKIDLSIIQPSGKVDKIKVEHFIPEFNFCHIKPNGKMLYIKLFIYGDNIIILYENSTDANLASFYGLIVDAHTGKVIRFI